MFDDPQITDEYNVAGSLQKELEKLTKANMIEVIQTQQIELTSDITGQQILCKATYAEETVGRFDTVSPLGLFSSHQGNQGMAAAMILAASLHHGEPTAVYEGHANTQQQGTDDTAFTAEWYYDLFVKKGLPEKKMKLRLDQYEVQEISVEALEERAERWFASL